MPPLSAHQDHVKVSAKGETCSCASEMLLQALVLATLPVPGTAEVNELRTRPLSKPRQQSEG